MKTYCEGRIYPNSIPEFRQIKNLDNTFFMEVRYVNNSLGYIGKWMPVKTEKETKE